MTNQITRQSVINQYLPAKTLPGEFAQSFAPSNIALCKYWGKRNIELNLPINGSLSISLAHLGSHTKIIPSTDGTDKVWLNDTLIDRDDPFALKVFRYVDLFRRDLKQPLYVHTHNNIATAAGLASSASGFAALMQAIDAFYQFDLPKPVVSAFARMGSGSACRSIYSGFVEWQCGEAADGMDSHAIALDTVWSELRIGLIKISWQRKPISSTKGMQQTLDTSILYNSWPDQVAQDLPLLKNAIATKDFKLLGQTAENNAISMHATMLAAKPAVIYWLPETLATMQKIWQLRDEGIAAYMTIDAGPNIKLLFLASQQEAILQALPTLQQNDVIVPFAPN